MKRGKSSDIQAVIFDVGGVLALGNKPSPKQKHERTKGVHEYIAKKLNISIDQWFDSIDSSYSDAVEGKISGEKALKIIAKNNKISSMKLEKIIIDAYRHNFKQNEQLFKQAFKLKQIGYKIAILSDQWLISRNAVMPKKLYKKFNLVVISYEVGIRKPNPKIYKLILEKLDLPPKECLFIDNQKWNLFPAKKIGIKVIQFKTNSQLFKNKLWKNLWKTS
ncbi:MAG: HAD-IA family hydrolase [Candidatus Pacearchaeota archaeon]